MLKVLAIVAAVVVAAVLVVLAMAAAKPDTFSVARSATINAPPEKIFPLINDLAKWPLWSPYETKDPAMKRSIGGAQSGQGATYAWEGNSEVGKGRMEIAESVPPSKVGLKLDFERPFEAHNLVDFTLEPKGDATTVTWEMRGPTPFFAKIIHVFFDMDRMVGTDFEAGLAKLKAEAEK
ncbi:MAG: SRPBCC family protein [Parvibaculaceae bacterium]